MDTSLWLWAGFVALTLALLAFDLGLLHRKSRETTVREAILLTVMYIVLALVFAGALFWFRGEEAGTAFLTGYLVEKALSVDNIFVFAIIFSSFAVPNVLQYKVLFWGVLGALIMRLVLILVGAALISQFHWIIYLLGGFLILTGLRMAFAGEAKPELEHNWVLRWTRRLLPVSERHDGSRFLTRIDGRLMVTPLLLVLILVEATDLVFALDSIPAIFAITTDPFIVYTSNVFAILGLRAMYFALAGVIDKFHFLKAGLALVLIFVGGKMLLNGVYGEHSIPTEWALAVTAILIFGSIVLSLLFPKPASESQPSEASAPDVDEAPARPVATVHHVIP